MDPGIASTSPNAAVDLCRSEGGDPALDSCAYCYAVLGGAGGAGAGVVVCPRCKKRKLCSEECRQRDWAVHQHFCGSAGEKNVDWAIRDCSADGKGYGVVALRDFRFGEVIMYSSLLHAAPQFLYCVYERCAAASPAELVALSPPPTKAAAMLLYGETPEEKYEGYAMGRLGSTRGIFIEMGRVNHACVPTPADHTWLESRQCKILSACGEVHEGMEITFSYRGDMLLAEPEDRKEELKRQWGFGCECAACRGEAAGVREYDAWLRYQALDKQVDRLCRRKRFREALGALEEQRAICSAARFCPAVTWERLLFDLFQMQVELGDMDAAAECARQAGEYAALVWGEDAEETAQYRAYAADPAVFFQEGGGGEDGDEGKSSQGQGTGSAAGDS